jgi:hypothetical protein
MLITLRTRESRPTVVTPPYMFPYKYGFSVHIPAAVRLKFSMYIFCYYFLCPLCDEYWVALKQVIFVTLLISGDLKRAVLFLYFTHFLCSVSVGQNEAVSLLPLPWLWLTTLLASACRTQLYLHCQLRPSL